MNLHADLTSSLDRFWHCRRGTLTVLLALLLPILAMGSVGVDQSAATAERTRLYANGMATPLRLRWAITSTASIDAATRAVTVRQTAHRASFFGSLLPPGGWKLEASATAIRTARKPLCVLGSQGTGPTGSQDSITVQGNSQITASDCLVQSNANLVVSGSGMVWAGEARAAGGASGSIRPKAVTDALPVKDPFARMAIAGPVQCDSFSISLGSGTFYLNPGVHCGEISVLGNSNLVLAPGDHYFVGPSLAIGGSSTITGSDVVVILRNLSSAQVTGSAVLQLEGRKSGPYAGFVLITDRSLVGDIEISTTNARKLLGTIYCRMRA